MPFLAPLLAAVTLIACDDTRFPSGGGGGESDTGVPLDYEPDWGGTRSFLADHCYTCHGDADHGGGGTAPSMPAGIVADVESGAGAYVVAGDPAASVLWRVISGEFEAGDVGIMPFGRTEPLPEAQIEHVKAWIEAGASLDFDTE